MRLLKELPYYKKSGTTGYVVVISTLLWVLLSVLVLCSCSTVTPDHVQDQVLAADSSTPAGIPVDNNGWLGWHDATHGIITANKRDFYNNLIADYRLQYRETYKVELKLDAGLTHIDIRGTTAYLIDLEHIKALARLKQWQVNQKPTDSVWLKILNKVGA